MNTDALAAPGVTGADLTVTLSRADAQRLTDRIKLLAGSTASQLDKLQGLVEQAEVGQAHIALGFPSWTAYLADVLSELHLLLDRDDRRQIVGYLSDKGMSTRAVASALGISQSTAARSRSGESHDSPDEPEVVDGEVVEDSAVPIHLRESRRVRAIREGWARPLQDGRAGIESQSEPRRVTGLDGKVYALPTRPTARTPGTCDLGHATLLDSLRRGLHIVRDPAFNAIPDALTAGEAAWFVKDFRKSGLALARLIRRLDERSARGATPTTPPGDNKWSRRVEAVSLNCPMGDLTEDEVRRLLGAAIFLRDYCRGELITRGVAQ